MAVREIKKPIEIEAVCDYCNKVVVFQDTEIRLPDGWYAVSIPDHKGYGWRDYDVCSRECEQGLYSLDF